MRKYFMFAAGLGAVAVALVWVYFARPYDFKAYELLQEPRLVIRPDQKMLVVEVSGAPHSAAREAMAVLFHNYYALKQATRGLKAGALRARWPRLPGVTRDQWLGVYALPLPETVEAPPCKIKALSPVRIEVWEYGPVAEILHVGPYSEAGQTLGYLRQFIRASGYAVAGPQEEEYLRGPGLMFKGDPKKYLTIIRYRVEKKMAPVRYQSL